MPTETCVVALSVLLQKTEKLTMAYKLKLNLYPPAKDHLSPPQSIRQPHPVSAYQKIPGDPISEKSAL